MRNGLDVLLDDSSRLARLADMRVGVACNHTAIDLACDHLVDLLPAKGVALKRIFTPEHGLHATAQDMIHVPFMMSRDTRKARVLVLPVPAPAMMSSARSSSLCEPIPCSAA